MSDTPTLWTETINELRAQLAEVQRERDEWRARHAAVAQAAASSWLSLQRTEAVLTEARAEAAAAVGALREARPFVYSELGEGHPSYQADVARVLSLVDAVLSAPGRGKMLADAITAACQMLDASLRRAFEGGET